MKKLGIFLMLLVCIGGVMATEDINIDMDVDSGFVNVDLTDTMTTGSFEAMGEFEGSFEASGNGFVDMNALVESENGASFTMIGEQFLSGYTDNKVRSYSFAVGDKALMNNRFDTSNYVVQFERVDTSKDLLSAEGENYGIGFNMQIKNDMDYSALTSAMLNGDGSGRFDTNQWHPTSIGTYGWGNPDTINMPGQPGYYTPTNIVEATGDGEYTQYGYGANSLSFNGFELGSGEAMFNANFIGGFSGSFGARAN